MEVIELKKKVKYLTFSVVVLSLLVFILIVQSFKSSNNAYVDSRVDDLSSKFYKLQSKQETDAINIKRLYRNDSIIVVAQSHIVDNQSQFQKSINKQMYLSDLFHILL